MSGSTTGLERVPRDRTIASLAGKAAVGGTAEMSHPTSTPSRMRRTNAAKPQDAFRVR